MTGLVDVVSPILPPGMGPIMVVLTDLVSAARKAFGTGQTPRTLPPPPMPPPAPPTGGTGPTQEEIDRLNQQIAQLQEQITQAHQGGVNATDQSGGNSNEGRQDNDGILNEGNTNGALLGPQQGTPEGQAAALQVLQRQIDALTQNVQEKANNAGGIADALRNFGTAMPAMGMPSMGMPSMGMPSMGMPALGGLGGPQVAPVAATPPPVVSAHPADDQQGPAAVRSTTTEPGAGGNDVKPAVTTTAPLTTAPPDPPPAPITTPGPTTTTTPPPAAAPPATPAPPAAAGGTKITLPSGQVVTAPNEAAAAAVRTALTQPAGHGDVASTAYSGTGVSIPTDGAEPGRKIDPADLKPGDVAVFDDHTALVAGNGQLVGPDGKLQPLGVINDANNFHGFYRPTETADIPAAVNPHEPAGVSATPPHTSTPTAPPPGATLASAPAPSLTAGHPPAATPAATGHTPASAVQPGGAPMSMPLPAAAAAKPAAPSAPAPPPAAHDH